ncbi:hypothetical protein [Jannaschia sp. M317]|uniref:hypothetical protein n=1 Tax=Jannaschia sp. M317 TaxID=2867011 RepID=UPI0021A8EA96|nr:hypothetical protein [Jannaschia sp. M317]UWQ19633.1 hypothetical protein K3551_04945 [Jannaschia sp. M317]
MFISTFVTDEHGAVTVDWVVLTAAATGLVLATMTLVAGGTEEAVNDINDAMNAPSVLVRLRTGFGYAPHDVAGFETLLRGVAALDGTDRAELAAFSNAMNGMIGDGSDPDAVGLANDLDVVVNIAYDNAGETRPTGTGYNAADLSRISSGLGYTVPAIDTF